MGSGGSTVALSDEHKETIHAALHPHYHSSVSKGVSDAELQKILASKYTELVNDGNDANVPNINVSDIAGEHLHDFFKSQGSPEKNVFTSSSANNIVVGTQKVVNEKEKVPSPDRKKSVSGIKPEWNARRPSVQDEKRALRTSISGNADKAPSSLAGIGRRNSNSGLPPPVRQKSNRRSSFDPKVFKEAGPADKLKAGLADQTITEEEAEVDTWASTTMQPTCTICGLTFTTEARREQHVKYSEMHALKLKDIEKLNNPEKEKQPEPVVLEDDSKLMYSGHKLYWKTRLNVDVHIYVHVGKSVLEVILFDSQFHTELPRIYLSMKMIVEAIGEEAITAKMAEVEAARPVEELNNVKDTPEAIAIKREDAIRAAVSSYVLSRLIQKESTDAGHVVAFQMSTLDNPEMNPVLTDDCGVLPVTVFRRRRTSISDATSTIMDVVTSATDATSLTSTAERHSQEITKNLENV
mmetsp:Transcript_23128/g.23336  ORF Transcript_23128/g.23336 Transcript_23128/m.23336 type:complete len:467 (-) Transcript_23128:237-1637(-)|eukprot:CAMPEP_0182420198 /NCGR_PEP_ID=MMETSP1167-20130531/4813_1 /TAXON_ID=2988 /ORGANISM="Mallomonas Sp, Strain CCMP3275" /LENGTH=466 /DNA_ID=CAMNT_0024595819 /DNA_START=100 /DNA_END=1500 /DNA_ORIENTATION=-